MQNFEHLSIATMRHYDYYVIKDDTTNLITCYQKTNLQIELKSHFHICLSPAFKDRPATPPSRAQEILFNRQNHESESSSDDSFAGSIKRLMLNPGYVILLITYGLNVGVFYAISTLLNKVVLKHFEVRK